MEIESSASRVLAIGVAAPAVAVTLAVIVFSGLEISGRTPFALGPPRNIAEAAAMGAPSEVMRLLIGEDPNRVWPVRSEIISSTVTRVTGLEAAVWSRRRELIEMLDRRGVIVDAETQQHLICLASDIGALDLVEYLSRGRPSDCLRGRAVEVVLERSRATAP